VPIDLKPRILSTAITETDGTATLDLAFEVAGHFGLKPDGAREIASAVEHAVKRWRDIANRLALSAAEIERMASAFEA
jgi:hypothetical protein